MNFIKTKDNLNGEEVKLCYEDYGKGKPVVLIHGWPLTKEMWEYQLDALVNAGLRVITYDRRGFGKSSRPWNGYDYDTLTDDLKAVLDELNLKDVTLVGFSMGGGEVARYFTRYGGENVSKIVLISSIVPYMLKTDDNPDGVPEEKMNEMLEQIEKDRIGFLDTFGKQFFGVNLLSHPVSTPLLDYYRMLCSMASPKGTKECMKSFGFTDLRDDAKAIDVPALIIHGDADKTVPIKTSSEQAAELIENNTYIVYEGAPHGLFYTEKERLNRDLISFITTGVASADPEEYKSDMIMLPDNDALVTRDIS
ncbi:MAG: alpha/beta hydrolase [Parafilimonas sp.]